MTESPLSKSSATFGDFKNKLKEIADARSAGNSEQEKSAKKVASDLLCEIYYTPLEKYTHRKFYTILRPGQDTGDIVHHVFEKALVWIDKGKLVVDDSSANAVSERGETPIHVQNKRSFQNFLQTVITNTLRDRYDGTVSHPPVVPISPGDSDGVGIEILSPAPPVSEEFRSRERFEEIRKHLSEIQKTLRPDEWYKIKRRYVDEVSPDQLAAELGIKSPDALRVELYRIRKKVAKSLAYLRELIRRK